MKNFFIIANRSKEGIDEVQNKIVEFLRDQGASCVVNAYMETNGGIKRTDMSLVPKETECVIVLGGDGTLLQAASDLADIRVPFLGINMGTLGFLAAASRDDAINAVKRMLQDDYVVERRMMIFGSIKTRDKSLEDPRALNEIVITGISPMQLINLSVYVNGQFLHKYYADGIIVSTPTGSTGYNLSAGGPIINPTAQTIVLTAICPHSMQNRSIVFSAEDVIRIDVEPNRYGDTEEVEVRFDGVNPRKLKSGDSITIRRSEKSTKIVKLKEESFLETLQNKLKD